MGETYEWKPYRNRLWWMQVSVTSPRAAAEHGAKQMPGFPEEPVLIEVQREESKWLFKVTELEIHGRVVVMSELVAKGVNNW